MAAKMKAGAHHVPALRKTKSIKDWDGKGGRSCGRFYICLVGVSFS